MQRTSPPQNNGGLFKKGSIFGGGSKTPTSTRPTTSNGSANIGPLDSINSQGLSSFSTTSLSRKASFSLSSKSPKNLYKPRTPSIGTVHASASPEKRPDLPRSKSKPPVSLASPEYERDRRGSTSYIQPLPTDIFAPSLSSAYASGQDIAPSSNRDSIKSTAPYSEMLSSSIGGSVGGYRPGTSYSNGAVGGGGPGFATTTGGGPLSPSVETITYQHIQDMASKRISTLSYLRKAHEGGIYWFNTLQFNKPDLQKMPYFDTRKLARRATNYLLLGLSLPIILDLNSSTPLDFLRALNILLTEFESYQQIHPPDGSSSSLSRARIPQMFKRATTTGSKGRRTSSAAEIGLPYGSDNYDSNTITTTLFPSSENDLLPGEEYTHLLTPSLPFDPDFYETFATLCDVLIDCYTRLMGLVASPKECGPLVAEAFTKADARVRKIIVQGVVKEFEDESRKGVRTEVAGVGKVVLGGLM